MSNTRYADHVFWSQKKKKKHIGTIFWIGGGCFFPSSSSYFVTSLVWILVVCDSTSSAKELSISERKHKHTNQWPNESNKRLTWTFVTVTMPFHNDYQHVFFLSLLFNSVVCAFFFVLNWIETKKKKKNYLIVNCTNANELNISIAKVNWSIKSIQDSECFLKKPNVLNEKRMSCRAPVTIRSSFVPCLAI